MMFQWEILLLNPSENAIIIEEPKLSNANNQGYQIFRKHLTENPKPNESEIKMSRNLVFWQAGFLCSQKGPLPKTFT